MIMGRASGGRRVHWHCAGARNPAARHAQRTGVAPGAGVAGRHRCLPDGSRGCGLLVQPRLAQSLSKDASRCITEPDVVDAAAPACRRSHAAAPPARRQPREGAPPSPRRSTCRVSHGRAALSAPRL